VAAPTRQLVSSANPLEATVGYSRAVRVGDRVWVSGTCAVWPDGSVDPDPGAQARRIFEIVGAALAEAGASLADVVRTRMFVLDVADFPSVAEVHGEVFGDIRPATSGLVVSALVDPRWKVEIEFEAVVTSRV
jgi:enamine deaminase RidA (YjgF/YER057c/UK114 family)